MMANIIIKKYEHWNRSFKNWDHPMKGKWIGSRHEYEKAMTQEGMISMDEAEDRGYYKLERKEYKLTNDSKELINSVHPDSKGRIKPGTKAIDALMNNWLPEHYREKI